MISSYAHELYTKRCRGNTLCNQFRYDGTVKIPEVPELVTYRNSGFCKEFRNNKAILLKKPLFIGNGRNIVSITVSEERAHWALRQTRRVLRETRWVCFGTQIIGWKELTELAPGTQVSQNNSLFSVFETVLPETVFGPEAFIPSPTSSFDVPHCLGKIRKGRAWAIAV